MPAAESCGGVRNSSKGENLDWFYQLYNKCCPEEERELFGKSFSRSHYYIKVEYFTVCFPEQEQETGNLDLKLKTWTGLSNFKRATSLTIILHTFKSATSWNLNIQNIQMGNLLKSIKRQEDQNAHIKIGIQLKSIKIKINHILNLDFLFS